MLSQPLLDDRLCLQLLPRSAYSARDPAQRSTLGVTLERQQGVHAIDSDHRQDFDTWPGTLALTPAGIEVFPSRTPAANTCCCAGAMRPCKAYCP